jgi:hypothetical protein
MMLSLKQTVLLAMPLLSFTLADPEDSHSEYSSPFQVELDSTNNATIYPKRQSSGNGDKLQVDIGTQGVQYSTR